jgi:hypothetical protein
MRDNIVRLRPLTWMFAGPLVDHTPKPKPDTATDSNL